MSGFNFIPKFSNIKELLEAAGSDIGVNGKKITNIGAPVDPQDAATKAYVDANNETGVASLTSTDRVFYVSKGAKASDSNDGLSFGKPLATIGAALTALGTSPGIIHLLPGQHDAPVGGIALGPDQAIRGHGGMSSRIMGLTSTAGYVLALKGSRSAARELWILGVPANSTGVRVTVGLPVNTHTNENSELNQIIVGSMQANSVAFGIGDDTDTDVSETFITNCSSVGNFGVVEAGAAPTRHMVVGNASYGNVLDAVVIGGVGMGHEYGIVVQGGGAIFRGVSFGWQSQSDIWIRNLGVGHTSFDGGRSENSTRFLVWDAASVISSMVKVENYVVLSLRNTDGFGVKLNGSGPVKLTDVGLSGLTAPQRILVWRGTFDDDYTPMQVFNNVASDHPFPFGTPWGHPSQNIIAEHMRFVGDNALQLWNRRKVSTFPRRKSIVSGSGIGSATIPGAAYSMNARNFEYVEIRLSGNAGTFTLAPGDCIGQRVVITFIQDGAGGWTYTWPTTASFTGGSAPANATTAFQRQTAELRWTGSYWEQYGAVVDSLPPTPVADPVEDHFTTGNAFWLKSPDTTGTREWEHVPGGGSFGINNGMCQCVELGTLGDTDNNINIGFAGPFAAASAAAVYDTGMTTTPTGIEITFVHDTMSGLVVQYADDQTMVLVAITDSQFRLQPYANGKALGSFTYFQALGTSLTAGSTHTLLFKITATGYEATLDGGLNTIGGSTTKTFTTGASDFALVKNATKHGILAGSLNTKYTKFKVS